MDIRPNPPIVAPSIMPTASPIAIASIPGSPGDGAA